MSISNNSRDGFVGKIAALSDPLSEMNSLSPLVQLLALAYQVDIPPHSKQERLITLLNTIWSTASSPSPSSPSRSPSPTDHGTILGSYIRFLSPVLNGFAGMQEFEAAVRAFSKPDDFRDFWDLEGKNLIAEFVSNGSERMVKGSDVPFLDKFVRDQSCRVALTGETKKLVLVNGGCEVGDEVWEVEDGTGLRVRRRQGEGWEDLGRARVDASALE